MARFHPAALLATTLSLLIGCGASDTGAGGAPDGGAPDNDAASVDTVGDTNAADGGDADAASAADTGDVVPADADVMDGGSADVISCAGEAPGCPAACGGDAFYPPSICKDGAWFCDKGVLMTDCPKDICWGPAMAGNTCEKGKWVCKPDKDDYAKCPTDMCLTCDGFSGPVTQDGCSCVCVGNKVKCSKGKLVCKPISTSTSNLNGVAIVFPEGDCTATLAQVAAGLKIPYQIDIGSSVEGVVALPSDAGQCDKPDGSGLIPFASVEGDGQKWCICDSGLCMGPDKTPKTLAAGSYDSSFTWDGVNWWGPSDFGNPKGKPFPVGAYTISVKAKGYRVDAGKGQIPFEVVGTRIVILTP